MYFHFSLQYMFETLLSLINVWRIVCDFPLQLRKNVLVFVKVFMRLFWFILLVSNEMKVCRLLELFHA